MGISFSGDTIFVTGGSQDDPYTMDDLDADGVVGGYITPGGYGDRDFAVSKDLVIGSDDADTFFDLTNSVISMNAGVYLTVYTTALRGGSMGATFGDREGKTGTAAILDETVQKQRIEHVKKMYMERLYVLDNVTGDWALSASLPRIVAVAEDSVIACGPFSA